VSSSAWVNKVLPTRWLNQMRYDCRGAATAMRAA
jgi:hypothetical protein